MRKQCAKNIVKQILQLTTTLSINCRIQVYKPEEIYKFSISHFLLFEATKTSKCIVDSWRNSSMLMYCPSMVFKKHAYHTQKTVFVCLCQLNIRRRFRLPQRSHFANLEKFTKILLVKNRENVVKNRGNIR